VAPLISTQLVLVLHPSVPANNLKEFIALAKARPNQLNFAAVGTGSSTHLAGELFKTVTGVKMQHVAYKGTAPALTDLIGGQVQLNFDTPVTSLPHIRAGKLKPIAITGKNRLASLPDVPTFAEAGLPEYDFQIWFGVIAPAGTPRDIIGKISKEIARILRFLTSRTTSRCRDWTPSKPRPTSLAPSSGPTWTSTEKSSRAQASRSTKTRRVPAAMTARVNADGAKFSAWRRGSRQPSFKVLGRRNGAGGRSRYTSRGWQDCSSHPDSRPITDCP